jgi:hypothetical protein
LRREVRHVSRRNQRLIREFGGEVMPYRDLPRPAQLAMAWYMAVDGEAWELPPEYPPYVTGLREIKKNFSGMLSWFVKTYGKRKFGYVEIPADVLIESIMEDPEIKEQFKGFEDYHRWYVRQGHMPDHESRNRWPVILSHDDEETLQDGWHRFHEYVRQGARVIPALYYA